MICDHKEWYELAVEEWGEKEERNCSWNVQYNILPTHIMHLKHLAQSWSHSENMIKC